VLAALGREVHEEDGEHVRAYVGALLIVEAVQELKNIRKLLTAPKDSK
jgi:hypothetical protein